MPVRATVIVSKVPAYICSCDDCKDWSLTLRLKRNADTAMLAHRILKHGYIRRVYAA